MKSVLIGTTEIPILSRKGSELDSFDDANATTKGLGLVCLPGAM